MTMEKTMRGFVSIFLCAQLLACGADPDGPSLQGIDSGGYGAGYAATASDASGTAQDAGDDASDDAPDGTPSDDAEDAASGTLLDVAAFDGGAADTGASQPDTTAVDTGTLDTGALDTGSTDTLTVDAGQADADTPDTGTPDTGTPDTGTPDSGSKVICGDLVCASSESVAACPFDCSATGKVVWPCVKSACGVQTQTCQPLTGCVTAVGSALLCADACKTLDASCVAKCQQAVAMNPAGLALLSCGVTKGCIVSTSGPICGDGKCEGSEKPLTCPMDCKAVCGDAVCELPETVLTCAKDCKPTFPPCGDGTCAAGESATSCPFDCDAGTAKVYSCVKGKCPTQTATCLKQPACKTSALSGISCALGCKKGDIACLSGCGAKTAGNAAATALVSCGLSCFL